MFQGRLPVDVGVAVEEMVVMMVPIGLCQMIRQLAVGHGRRLLTGIDTGLIEGYRVKGSEHADVRQDRRVVFGMTVAVR